MTKKKENRSNEAIKEDVANNIVIKKVMLKNRKMGKKGNQEKELTDIYSLKGEEKKDETDYDEYINECGNDEEDDDEDLSEGGDDEEDDGEYISEGTDGEKDDSEYISEGTDGEEDISDSGDDEEDITEDGEDDEEDSGEEDEDNDKNESYRKTLDSIRKKKSESEEKTLQKNIHGNKQTHESEYETEDDLLENPFSNIEEVKPLNLSMKQESDEAIKETKNKTSQKRINELNRFYEDATKEKKKAKHTIEEEIEDPGLKWVEDNWFKDVPRKELRF